MCVCVYACVCGFWFDSEVCVYVCLYVCVCVYGCVCVGFGVIVRCADIVVDECAVVVVVVD